MPHYTALVTLVAVFLYFFAATRVPLARRKFTIKLPATSGHPDFERVFRAHQNTLEWLPIFLPSLWLFALYVSDPFAAVIGLIWIGARVLYIRGYTQAVEKRLPGFFVQGSAVGVLFIGALAGVLWRLIHGG
ncbi:MAG TPA: MAPEG family protein [Pseudolabrys sp.]|nr:MAPEG family protein [Pseudolabrys sp.]